MSHGTIKKKVEDKGFGFIQREGSDKDLFFHATACNGGYENLREGQRVTFEEGRGDKGPRAENVQPA
jgi:CspA family cold shock protein